MKAEAEANAEADKKLREDADLINKADSTIFQTERQLKEYGDKIPADKKQPIEDALSELKKEFEAKNTHNLQPAIDRLNTAFQEASQDLYNAANANEGTAQNASEPADEVTDVDFEEVGDKK
jgi:molecular chaperone DnaK